MAVSMHRMPADTRPRERLAQLGVRALSDAELLALVIGTGRPGASAVEVAAELLAENRSLSELARARPEELARVGAVGHAKAAGIVAAFELGRRAEARPTVPPRITGPADIAAAVRPQLGEARREELFLIVLGGGNRLRRVERVTSGGPESCALDEREILAAVLRHDGSAFALAHTHPSGNPSPSGEDVAATRDVAAAARQVGLRLVDHVILAGARWTSLAALGYLDGPESRSHQSQQRFAAAAERPSE